METFKGFILIIFGAILLSAAVIFGYVTYVGNNTSNVTNDAGVSRLHCIEGGKTYGLSIYVDTQTGVEYFVYSDTHGIAMSPIYNHDGSISIAEGY